ncbi:DsbA family oxidoreductase [Sphingomonas sp. GlSt437]|uniref:DsbA family oxidoreductase n=1 Tax=Sphingomonas sp. GlSt437 TaxID=3389970 RepID=UPI003A87F132
MHVDIVYDFLCPWCHVAQRHFTLAVAAHVADGGSAPVMRWRQYMLYPYFDRAGHDFLGFFRQRYGEDLRVPMWEQIRSVAEPIGINFAFEKITRGPASIDGHRLVRWAEAKQPGVSGSMINDLGRSFFGEARVIDDAFLIELAEWHGFDGEAARRHLASDLDIVTLLRETETLVGQGLRSMPHYEFRHADGSVTVIRQTSVAAFRRVLSRATGQIEAQV